MTVHPFLRVAVLVLPVIASACGTPKEKTAPCKRPAGLTNFAPSAMPECGAMRLVNTDQAAVLRAIEMLQGE